jgi:hypothetical protein
MPSVRAYTVNRARQPELGAWVLKTLKRQMFGRANFDLLRFRVLHAL